jgi:hypothetical protein
VVGGVRDAHTTSLPPGMTPHLLYFTLSLPLFSLAALFVQKGLAEVFI